jgi:hypothetical protein
MQIEIGNVKEWHNPRDESCPHNGDVARDCGCKKPRKKKPYRRVAVTDNGVGHRTNPNLIFEIYFNGTVTMREKKRKKRFSITAATLYSILMERAADAHRAAKRKARGDRKKARKVVRR